MDQYLALAYRSPAAVASPASPCRLLESLGLAIVSCSGRYPTNSAPPAARFATLGGIILGLFSGWGLAEAIGKHGPSQFAVPAVPLAVIVVVGGIAGVLAAVRPANRAARLNVLQAVVYE